jgi:hypothetical protein
MQISIEQVGDFLAAVDMSGTLDGQPLPDLNGYWGGIEPYEGGPEGRARITSPNGCTPWVFSARGRIRLKFGAPWPGLSRMGTT